MKNKHSCSSKKARKTSSTKNKNIDIRIPKIPVSFAIDKRNIIKRNSKATPKKKALSTAYTVSKTRKMNWKQLKRRFPGLSPTADADFDGLINSRDCKPFDPSKDGAFSRFIGVITGGKKGQSAEEYKAEKESDKLAKSIAIRERAKVKAEKKAQKIIRKEGFISEAQRKKLAKRQENIDRIRGKFKSTIAEGVEKKIRRMTPTTQKEMESVRARRKKIIVRQVEKFAGVRGAPARTSRAAKGQKGTGAGRPKQSFKYRDPRTGQPISAVEYHRLRKQLKRQAKTVETQTEVKQRFALAKKGLSPEEVSEAQAEINARMARLRAIKLMKQGGTQGTMSEEATLTEGYQATQEGQVVEGQEVAPAEIEYEEATQSEEYVAPQQVRQAPVRSVPQQYQRTQRVEPMTAVPGSYGIPQGYRLQEDLMAGGRRLVPLPPREAWTR